MSVRGEEGVLCGDSLPERQPMPRIHPEMPSASFFHGVSDNNKHFFPAQTSPYSQSGFCLVSISGLWLAHAGTCWGLLAKACYHPTFSWWVDVSALGAFGGFSRDSCRLLAGQGKMGWSFFGLLGTKHRFRRKFRVCSCPSHLPTRCPTPLQNVPKEHRAIFWDVSLGWQCHPMLFHSRSSSLI